MRAKMLERTISNQWLIKRLLILLVLCVGGWQAQRWLVHPNTLPIKQVRIEGEFKHLSTEMVSDALTGQMKGSYFGVDSNAMVKTLDQLPWVQGVKIRRVWPDLLVVSIHEKKPVARWNKAQLLNGEGQPFRVEISGELLHLPQLMGTNKFSQLVLTQCQRINASLDGLGLKVKTLNLAQHGSWTASLNNGMTVYVGKQLPNGLIGHSLTILGSLNKEILESIDSVDLRYPNGVSVTWKKNQKPDQIKLLSVALNLNNNQQKKS